MSYYLNGFLPVAILPEFFLSAVKSNIDKTSSYVKPTTFDSGLTLKTSKKLFSDNFLLKYIVFLFSLHVIDILLNYILHITYPGASECI